MVSTLVLYVGQDMNVIVLSMCTQTNGLTERFNQTLLRNLCKLIDDDKNNWDLKIETV